ncbi:MAG: hypothetical protein ABFS42_07500 [Candidatus Krumholzibacteriota bacterium]
MKKLSMLVLSVLCLALLTGPSFAADRQAVVTPVSGDAVTVNPVIQPTGANGVCQMGNLNPLAFAITDWVWGAEKYKYMFYADPGLCTACAEGFTVESVNLVLQFGPEDVPSTFDARVDFEEAIWDETLQCHYPGPEVCVSSTYTVTIDNPGLYNISLPMDAACACAHFGYWYGISFEFMTAFTSGMEPDLVTDEFPVGCTSWNDYGSGWNDLLDFGFPGEIALSAEIICCNNPVATDESTWGSIKAMFR